MLMGVAVIMGEEMFAPTPAPHPLVVWLANAPWIAFSLLALWRACTTRPVSEPVTRSGRSRKPVLELGLKPGPRIALNSPQGEAGDP